MPAPQLTLPFAFEPRYGADDFISGPTHQTALGWLARYPQWPGCGLILHGPAGCGKTHLLHMFCHSHNGQLVDLLSADDLLASPTPSALLVLDDVQDALQNNPAAQKNLFHLINRLHGEKGNLILGARMPPAGWNITLPDLRSRLLAMAQAEIKAPDEILCREILLKNFSDRQLDVADEVIQYILTHVGRQLSDLLPLISQLDGAALQQKRRITIPLVQQVLAHQAG